MKTRGVTLAGSVIGGILASAIAESVSKTGFEASVEEPADSKKGR